MNIKRRLILILIMLVSLTLLLTGSFKLLELNISQYAYTSLESTVNQEKGKVFFITIDRVVLVDFYNADTPNIDSVIQKGGIGLMTTNTGGSRSQRDAYLTMGAGTRVSASDETPVGLHAEEIYQDSSAGDIYKQITGETPPKDAIINIGFAQAVRNNAKRNYTVNIGALGIALRQAELHSAVIGNSDTTGEYKRYLVSFLMDDRGIVPRGDVGKNILEEDQSRPFGLKTDYIKIIESINRLWDTTDVFAVELGDTSRAEDFRCEATDKMNQHYKRLALEESDAFIGSLMQMIDINKDLLIITSAIGSGNDLAQNNRLTPVMIAGPGYTNDLLISASTRRPGILTNLDIGASILNYYDISLQGGQLGNRIYSSGEKVEIEELLNYNERLKEVNNQRPSLLRYYVTVLVMLLIISMLCVLFFRKYLPYAAVFLQFIMAVPISYLLLPLFHRPAMIGSLILSWLAAIGITLIVWIFTRKQNTIVINFIYCSIMSILLIVDQLYGAPLIAASPLGYDIISGARYYGLGNEYMGILVGAVCTGAGAICQIRFHKAKPLSTGQLLLIFLLPLLVLIHPGIGANVGGTISALAAFLSFLILQRENHIRLRHLIPIGAITAAFLIFIFAFDSIRAADSQSHMGQTVSLIKENGFTELLLIAKRKMEMNIRLFRYTIWTRVFLLSLFIMAMLLFRPVGILRIINSKYPYFIKGIVSGMIGCIIALLANDSGIVAAGTCMIYLAPPVLLAVMEHLPDRSNKIPWEKVKQ